MQVSGTIERIEEAQRNTSRGPATAYSVYIDGARYGHGFKKPPYPEGTAVAITYSGDYKNIDSMVVVDASNIVTPVAAPANKQASSAPTAQQQQIMRQNAVTNANATFAQNADLYPNMYEVLDLAEEYFTYYVTGNVPEDPNAPITGEYPQAQ